MIIGLYNFLPKNSSNNGIRAWTNTYFLFSSAVSLIPTFINLQGCPVGTSTIDSTVSLYNSNIFYFQKLIYNDSLSGADEYYDRAWVWQEKIWDLRTLAPKESPVLTGVPIAPTAAFGTNTTQIATTAFVQNAIIAGDKIGYQLRTNETTLSADSAFRKYRLLFTSADGTKFIPANTTTGVVGNQENSLKTINQTPINPFGKIYYYNKTTNVSQNNTPDATALFTQYIVPLGYSFNTTGETLTLTTNTPIYIKCAPQSDGSAIIDATTPYVQALPSSEDGKIYIYLGVAVSGTTIELVSEHPVYYYSNSKIQLWTGTTIPTVPTSDITANTNARHTHSNKALLDTYTQTEINLADAVSKKHTHSNKSALDDITVEKISAWDSGVINHANKTDLPLIVTGTCAFGTSLTSGTDAIISVTNVSHTIAQIAAAVTANRPIYFVLTNNSMKLMLQYSTYDGSNYYFTNAYDPFTSTAYDNESFNITVIAKNENSTDSFIYVITYNKNVFVTQSAMTTAINTAVGGITEFDTQVVQSLPSTGVNGTIYFTPNNHGTNNIYDEFIYVNNAWEKIGNTQVDLSDYVLSNDLAYVAFSGDYENLNNKPTIPTKVSDLTNDSGFVNVDTAQDIAWLNFDGTYITDPWEMSDLGPLTGSDVYAEYVMTKKAVPIVIYNNSLYYYQSGNNNTDIKYFNPENNTILTHSNSDSNVSINTRTIFNGDYNNLINKPILFSGNYNDLTNKPTLFSGDYDDLTNKPTIPSATITSGVKIAEINGTAIYAPAYANGDQIAY